MVGSGRTEMIASKGCSKMYADVTCTMGTNSFRGNLQPPRPSASSNSPFSGLVICVTGLSKEAKKQVMDATERLGGQFSPHLHPKCTHLVVQSSYEGKSEYTSKHGAAHDIFIVTLGWFVDSVRRNARLNESLYGVKSFNENYTVKDDVNMNDIRSSCLPVAMIEHVKQSNLIQRSKLHPPEENKKTRGLIFSAQTVYVDPDVSAELRNKVVETVLVEGGLLVNQWLVGHNATHVVCEGPSVQKYFGHFNTLVTPEWVMKSVMKRRSQRLVHLSADLACHVGMMLGNVPGGNQMVCSKTVIYPHVADGSRDEQSHIITSNHKENQRIAFLAKEGVRNRRCHHTQAGQTSIKPSTRSILLNSISWTMSEPSSTAYVCTDSFSFNDAKTSECIDANESTKESDACFVNLLRPLSEREKSELVYGNHFITILFPVDRFTQMGPCSRTFFSNTGFTCSQLLDRIYEFYQENMSTSEIELAIHTDSRHADNLRSMYSSKEAAECGFVELKRINFLGSRRSFEMLKRVPVDNNKNVYELLTRS